MIDIEKYKSDYYNYLTREELWHKHGGTRRESYALFSSMNPKRDYKGVVNKTFKKNNSMEKRRQSNLKKYGVTNTLNLRKNSPKGNPEGFKKAREIQKKIRQENPGIWSYNVRKGLQKKFGYSDLYMLLDEDNYEFLMYILEEFGKPKIYDLCFATGLQFAQAQKYVNRFGLRDRFDIEGSILEEKIKSILDDAKVNYIYHDREQIRPLELDFYLPKYKFAIEINDIWSHTDESHPKNYHKMKSNMCKEKGIFLMHIFEWEFEKLDIIKSMIYHKLGLSKSINGGSCKSRLVSAKEAREFLNKNHRQGYGSSASIHYILYFRKEPVACMTFRRCKEGWELYRFANKCGISVRMGAYRLLEKFKKENDWNCIISFSDIAHTTGNLYEKLGFQKVYETSPNYVWVSRNGIIYQRVLCQKHKLSKLLDNYDERLSESQNMKNNFYKRVYDSGNIKWKMIKN